MIRVLVDVLSESRFWLDTVLESDGILVSEPMNSDRWFRWAPACNRSDGNRNQDSDVQLSESPWDSVKFNWSLRDLV
jgi:hypothetical protein